MHAINGILVACMAPYLCSSISLPPQVQQELSSTFARLCHLADETTQDMQESIDKIDTSLAKLEEGASRSKVLRNQANFIANKLELFDRTYLNSSAAASDQDSN